MPSVVALDRIAKAYETKVAVASLSLSIEAGTMFGLLGPNGAGKTSTIRMITGITLPDSGTVSLFGRPFTRAALRRVGYLPEERGLYKKMRVLDQLIFIGQLHGLDAATARRRSVQWCEKLRIPEALEGSAGKKTDELSKGMQQKIQFIATLLHEPELIIMDEPFSGLDPVNAILLEDALLELKRAGRAILFSTHRMDQVEKLCDAICLVDQGRAVLAGSMREVKGRFERDKVQMQYSGSDAFLAHPAVAAYKQYADFVEIRLRPGADPQALLLAAASGAAITRFEVLEPSLEEIFIRTVGRETVADA
jgi:ABC-2 type transport system ATP-binding protein